MNSVVSSFRVPGVERREGAIEGVGLFANQRFAEDALLAFKGGRIMTEQTVKDLADVINGSHHQISPDLFIAGITPEEVDATMIGYNHSCQPNAYIDRHIALRTLREIESGEEVTVDYATIFSSDSQSFECRCGAQNCRHQIKPSVDSLSPDIIAKYDHRRADFLQQPDAYFDVELAPLDPTSALTSWRSTKLKPVRAKIHGDGVVSIDRIKKGELLALRNGRLMTEDEVKASQDVSQGSEIQLADEVFLGAMTAHERDASMTGFNHSCEPNAHLGGQIGVFALRDIEVGEELTVDYATAYISPTQRFACNCGTASCRGHVDSLIDWQRPELQRRYAGYFTDFIARKISNKIK